MENIMQEYSEHPLDHVPLVKEPISPLFIRTPKDIFPFCDDLTNLPQEGVFIILLNARCKVMERRMITWGIRDTTLFHPREVFTYAVRKMASSILVIHNHPSGDPTPSTEDIRMTKQLIEGGRILGISVMDHLVIGTEPKVYSLREGGMADFS